MFVLQEADPNNVFVNPMARELAGKSGKSETTEAADNARAILAQKTLPSQGEWCLIQDYVGSIDGQMAALDSELKPEQGGQGLQKNAASRRPSSFRKLKRRSASPKELKNPMHDEAPPTPGSVNGGAAGSQWKTAIDPATGRKYQYHVVTGESRWS